MLGTQVPEMKRILHLDESEYYSVLKIWIFWGKDFNLNLHFISVKLHTVQQCEAESGAAQQQQTCRDCGDMWYFNYLSRSKLSCLHSFNSVETVLQVVWRTLKCSHSTEWSPRPAPAISSVIRAQNGPAEKWRLYFDRLQESWCPEATLLPKQIVFHEGLPFQPTNKVWKSQFS